MYVIKIYEKRRHIGYLIRVGWDVTKYLYEAMIFDENDLIEAKRVAERFEDCYDAECFIKCKVVKIKIMEEDQI